MTSWSLASRNIMTSPQKSKLSLPSPSRQAQLHRNSSKTSKSKLARNSANRLNNSRLVLLRSFPPRTISIFPTLPGIRTISNTRIDKLVPSPEISGEDQLLPESLQPNNNLPVQEVDTEFLEPDPITLDSDFSYDYETYMQVTRSRRDTNNAYLGANKNYDINCNIIPNTTISSNNNVSWMATNPGEKLREIFWRIKLLKFGICKNRARHELIIWSGSPRLIWSTDG